MMSELFHCIEQGADWPRDLQSARAVFLPKDPSALDDPLQYRVLLMLSYVYRKWAALRLHQFYVGLDNGTPLRSSRGSQARALIRLGGIMDFVWNGAD